jgi:hypothetical protein
MAAAGYCQKTGPRPQTAFAGGYRVDARSICGESRMVWMKPEFEFLELCSEVTSYLYRR